MTAAIEAADVVKTYDDVQAVDHVDLSVAEGAIHGVVGPNGAGKTTLLAMLFGLIGADSGTVSFFGRPRPATPTGVLAGVAGFLSGPQFYPYLSARRNLRLLSAYDGRTDDGRIDRALAAVSLTDRAATKVGGFSVGMRQRLGIAAALIREPRVLILDEPASGLDPNGVRDLHAMLRRLAADGMTVLLSSHDMDEVESLCGSVTILRTGRVAFDGPIGTMREQAPTPSYRLLTSDHARTLLVAADAVGVTVFDDRGEVMLIGAEPPDLDAFVIALGKAGIAIRGLELASTALRSFFFALTGGPADADQHQEAVG